RAPPPRRGRHRRRRRVPRGRHRAGHGRGALALAPLQSGAAARQADAVPLAGGHTGRRRRVLGDRCPPAVDPRGRGADVVDGRVRHLAARTGCRPDGRCGPRDHAIRVRARAGRQARRADGPAALPGARPRLPLVARGGPAPRNRRARLHRAGDAGQGAGGAGALRRHVRALPALAAPAPPGRAVHHARRRRRVRRPRPGMVRARLGRLGRGVRSPAPHGPLRAQPRRRARDRARLLAEALVLSPLLLSSASARPGLAVDAVHRRRAVADLAPGSPARSARPVAPWAARFPRLLSSARRGGSLPYSLPPPPPPLPLLPAPFLMRLIRAPLTPLRMPRASIATAAAVLLAVTAGVLVYLEHPSVL